LGGEGEGGAQGAAIAVIARDRKPKTLPRIDADERGSLQGCTSQVHAKLGCLGMLWDTKGGGGVIADIAVIARHRRDRERPNLTTDKR